MDSDKFNRYLYDFEVKIISVGVDKGSMGKLAFVPIRNGKLSGTHFGRTLGHSVDSESLFAIDYYGYYKKSKGLLSSLKEITARQNHPFKAVEAILVSFPSIKIEDIISLSPDTALIVEFPQFKKSLLELRGIERRSISQEKHGSGERIGRAVHIVG